jgi:trans-aconitate 2-methyltransferase
MNSSVSKIFAWDPEAYASNSSTQQTWGRELIAKLDLAGCESILDVGCGDGKVTVELARVVPQGSVIGIDASPQMVEFARKAFADGENRNLEFQIMDARRIRLDRTFDLIFSNAALHWVDDHQAFLRGASACLRAGGRLMVSCGGKGNAQDVFVALRPEIRLMRWREFFRRMPKPYFFYAPQDYRKWLPRFGFKTRTVSLAPKDAVYAGRAGLTTWLRTTWLPYIQRVPEPLREEFIAAVADRYLAKHPPDAKGHVHVRMVRLEIDAVKV